MGYFVLNLEDEPTKEGLLSTIKANLELYEKSGYTYLLTDFVERYLEELIVLKEEEDNDKN